MFNKLPIKGKKTVCLVSGGNIDVTILARVVKRGLITNGRTCNLTVELSDKPGQLLGILGVVAEQGANVISINHERSGLNIDLRGCYVHLQLETRNNEHIAHIIQALTEKGYRLV